MNMKKTSMSADLDLTPMIGRERRKREWERNDKEVKELVPATPKQRTIGGNVIIFYQPAKWIICADIT